MLPLSVLDLSPVVEGSTGAVSLRNSIDLARLADSLGFRRYWVAEHHNLPSVASSAPEIMIGQIAAATEHIRVGSGGVMLPNHAPLMVAERFKVLEALFPGRIDLGIGRAPGTDPVTSYALRRRQDAGGDDDFLDRFQELILFEREGFPEGHPFRNVHAMPRGVPLPPIWLLGSSGPPRPWAFTIGMCSTSSRLSAWVRETDFVLRASRSVCAIALASRKSRLRRFLCMSERVMSGACVADSFARAKDAGSGLIRSPHPGGRKQRVVSTLPEGCQTA